MSVKRNKRRRAYVYNLGVKPRRPWNDPRPTDILKRLGFKAEIRAVNIVGISRVAVDLGYMKQETLSSLAGHSYSSISRIRVYAHPEDQTLIEVIIKGCGYDIIKDEDMPL